VPAGTHGPLCACSAKGLHSGIQVKPNTRPSLRNGWTAYAVLSREPSSFWPPSLQRNLPTPRRLTRMPPPQELDRSNDGQDHTVLPYAHSAARPHEAPGSRRAIRPALGLSCATLPRPPQPGPRFERLANRPSSSGRAVATYAAIPNFGKVEYFCEMGLTAWRCFARRGLGSAAHAGCLHKLRRSRGPRTNWPSHQRPDALCRHGDTMRAIKQVRGSVGPNQQGVSPSVNGHRGYHLVSLALR